MNRPAGQASSFQGLREQIVSHTPSIVEHPAAVPPSAPVETSSDQPSAGPSPPAPVDPAEYLASAPQDPITPPVIHVKAELLPGSVPTSEPLTPPVIEAPSPVPLDPASVTGGPLTPPVVVVGNPPEQR